MSTDYVPFADTYQGSKTIKNGLNLIHIYTNLDP